MGGKSSKETNRTIINDTDVRTAIRKLNKRLTEVSLSIIQRNLTNTATSATVSQSITLKHINTDGTVTISDITQENQVTISLSSLTDADLKQELVSDMQDELQAKITQLMEMTQDQAQSSGEQMISDLIGGVGGMVANITGGSSKVTDNTTLKNLLQIDNSVELVSEIKNAISTDIINETITNLSSNLNVEQSIELEDITAGELIVTNINQRNLSSQTIDAIAKSGLTSSIIAKMANVDKTDIDNTIKTQQEQAQQDIGTIESIGDLISSLSLPALIIVGIIIAVVLLIGVLKVFTGKK